MHGEMISRNAREIFLQRRRALAWRELTLARDKWEVGGTICHGGGQVGEQSPLMGSARISPCYVVLPAHEKLEMAIVNYDAR